MKKILKYLIIPSLIVIGMSSCEDEDKNPLTPHEELSKGVYFRSINSGGTINFYDLQNSSYTITGELVTPENGNDVQNIELWVEFKDRNTDNDESTDDDDSVASTMLASVSRSSLTTNTNGLLQHTFDVTVPEALTAMNLDESLVEGGDQIFFQVVINMNDGSSFDKDTTGDSIKGELFFASPFEYTASVVCLIIPEPGAWTLSMTDLYGDGWNGGRITVNLNGTQTNYSCEGTETTATITVPENSDLFTFTYTAGSWEGENLFTLTDPSGNIVLDEGVGDWSFENGPPEGELLNVCPD